MRSSTSLIWRVECSPVQPIANSAGFVHLGAALKLRLASDQVLLDQRWRRWRCLFQLQAGQVPPQSVSELPARARSPACSCTAIDAPARVADRGRRSAPLRRAVHVPVSGAGARSSTGIQGPCRLLVGDRIACARVHTWLSARRLLVLQCQARCQGGATRLLELPERHRANAHSCAGNQYGAPDQACGNHLGVH